MTREELTEEKLANESWYSEDNGYRIVTNESTYIYAFKKGLKVGRSQWHKPSEKLPEEYSLVLAYLFEETEPTICKYVVSNQWECLPKRIVFCSNDQIRLWKEIVLPKEIE